MRKIIMKKNDFEKVKIPDAIKRIGQQVSSLIPPDFRPLSKVLQDQIKGVVKKRSELAREIEHTQTEAMAAATQLKLIGDNNWQRPTSHMNKVKKITGEMYE